MAKAISNVVISTDTFAQWVGTTNEMADAFTLYALTANSSANGAQVTGNSAVVGIFAANTLAAITSIRGGTVETASNLNITSNAVFTGALLKTTANSWLEVANAYINGTTTTVTGGSLILQSNTYLNNPNVFVNSALVTVQGGSLALTSNVNVTVANIVINATAMIIRTGTLAVNSSVSISNTFSVTGNVTVDGDVHTVAGNVQFDTDTLFIDAANHRVGINNSTPDADLTITGTSNVSGNTEVGGNLIVRGTGVVNGSLTVANTAALGNTTITGFANVTTTLAAGNTTVTGFANISSTLAAGNTTITGFANISSTLNVTGAATVNGAVTINNTASISDTLTLKTDVVFNVVSNTNIGNANTASVLNPVDVLVLEKPFQYKSAKITSSAVSLNGANVQTQEMVLALSNTANDVSLTVYGTVSAPSSANVGVFTTSINATAAALKFTQTSANSSVKLSIQYIK